MKSHGKQFQIVFSITQTFSYFSISFHPLKSFFSIKFQASFAPAKISTRQKRMKTPFLSIFFKLKFFDLSRRKQYHILLIAHTNFGIIQADGLFLNPRKLRCILFVTGLVNALPVRWGSYRPCSRTLFALTGPVMKSITEWEVEICTKFSTEPPDRRYDR